MRTLLATIAIAAACATPAVAVNPPWGGTSDLGNIVCPECGPLFGYGYVPEGNQIIPCPTCEGNGIVPLPPLVLVPPLPDEPAPAPDPPAPDPPAAFDTFAWTPVFVDLLIWGLW